MKVNEILSPSATIRSATRENTEDAVIKKIIQPGLCDLPLRAHADYRPLVCISVPNPLCWERNVTNPPLICALRRFVLLFSENRRLEEPAAFFSARADNWRKNATRIKIPIHDFIMFHSNHQCGWRVYCSVTEMTKEVLIQFG